MKGTLIKKLHNLKILIESEVGVSIVQHDDLHEHHPIVKLKRTDDLL